MFPRMRAEIDFRDGDLEERQDRLLSAAGSPASVMTDRLCDASDDRSSSRAPGTRSIAFTIRSTTSVRRPSLTFGTDSINIPVLVPRRRLKASGYQLPATDYRL